MCSSQRGFLMLGGDGRQGPPTQHPTILAKHLAHSGQTWISKKIQSLASTSGASSRVGVETKPRLYKALHSQEPGCRRASKSHHRNWKQVGGLGSGCVGVCRYGLEGWGWGCVHRRRADAIGLHDNILLARQHRRTEARKEISYNSMLKRLRTKDVRMRSLCMFAGHFP
jgi:hypothetical protein